MTLMQYLHTTVYRYYIQQLVTKAAAVFTRRAALQLTVQFKNPRAGVIGQFRNPRAMFNDQFRNPRAGFKTAFEPIKQVAP